MSKHKKNIAEKHIACVSNSHYWRRPGTLRGQGHGLISLEPNISKTAGDSNNSYQFCYEAVLLAVLATAWLVVR